MLARAVFTPLKRSEKGESLIEEMIRSIQAGEPVPSSSHTINHTTKHGRIAHRLASISQPLPIPVDSSKGSQMTSSQILQAFPSSQTLLRHLPPSILAFTPFITPSPAPPQLDRLPQWQDSSLQLLREAIPSWLMPLQSVPEIWQVRSGLLPLLGEAEFDAMIRNALEDEYGSRIRDVWSNKLEKLVQSAETSIREAAEDIRLNGEQSGWST